MVSRFQRTALIMMAALVMAPGLSVSNELEAVSPGATDRIAEVEARCPTFIWEAIDGADSFELIVYRLPDGLATEALPALTEADVTEVLVAEVPGGAPAWTPDVSRALARGGTFVWFVRPRYKRPDGVIEAGLWSAGRYFSIAELSRAEEAAEAMEILRRYLAAGGTLDDLNAEGRRSTIGSNGGPDDAASHLSPRGAAGQKSVTTGKTAIKATVSDTTGAAYGLVGISSSVDGAGVGAAGAVGGPDIVLDGNGGVDTLLNQDGVYRPSATSQSFYIGNPGAGGMTLTVDGSISGDGSLLTGVDADLLDGLSPSDFAPSAHAHAGEDWPTVNTTYGLRVDNTGDYALFGGGGTYGVYGSGASYGLYGVSSDSVGVYGDGGSGTGDYGGYFTGHSGVYGNAENAAGYGVLGQSTATDISKGAVTGVNTSSGCCATGVSGIAVTGTDNFGFGVVGQADYVGVYGISPVGGRGDNGQHWGVYGAGGGTNGYGVYSSGNMHVAGTLTKTGGSFKIDHPQDPGNKYLYHSFVESPDMMNVYNGNVFLDGEGTAWVELPEYFEALNMDFRYQLTAVGVPGSGLHVASEIENNRFQIAGGEPYAKVSWQVTGIRNDPWARENRIVPVQDKPAKERGTFLHPESHGQSVERGFNYQFGPASVLRASVVDQDR
jgi:hypothetical protein